MYLHRQGAPSSCKKIYWDGTDFLKWAKCEGVFQPSLAGQCALYIFRTPSSVQDHVHALAVASLLHEENIFVLICQWTIDHPEIVLKWVQNKTESVSKIKEYKPKVACFVVYGQQPSASSQNMEGATALAQLLRDTESGIKILFVGGHVAALSREVMLAHSCIDFVCQNEGVYTTISIL